MKSATKKLSSEIAETLSGKIESIAAGSKKIKKSIEKAATKLAKKVAKFEKETIKAQAKAAKDEAKKAKGKGKKDEDKDKKKSKKEKLAALVASASSKPPVATPVKVNAGRPVPVAKTKVAAPKAAANEPVKTEEGAE